MPEFAPYCATKHALIGLVRSAAREYAGRVRVNAVCPATTDTPMVARFAARWPEWQARARARASFGVVCVPHCVRLEPRSGRDLTPSPPLPQYPRRQAATNAGYPIGRIATAGEVAEAVVWLAAGATFSTGTALVLDGGAGATAGRLRGRAWLRAAPLAHGAWGL
jgi:NAD(P)-dependent dehydrogenase (short-subunit alcohol dehydrogenase family)